MASNHSELNDEYIIKMVDFPNDFGDKEYSIMEELEKIENNTETSIKMFVQIKGNPNQVEEACKQILKFKITDKVNSTILVDSIEIQKNLLQSQNEANQKLKTIKNQMVNAPNQEILAELETIQNVEFISKDVFQSEMSMVISEMQEMKNKFDQKIMEMTNALNYNKLEIEAIMNTKLQELVQNEDPDLEEFFISDEYVNCKQYKGEQLLHTACRFGRLNLVQKLINGGISPYIKDKDGFTPLHYSCWFGRLNIVKYLVELNVPINDVDWKFGETPLIKASRKGHKAIVEYLCSKNAKVHIENKNGSTALYEASGTDRNQIIKILKKYGAEY